MATQIIEKFIDDLTGGDAAETIPFGVDGTDYTIDLNEKNAARLRRALRPYIDKSVRVRAGRRLTPEETPEGRRQIRQWARTTGDYPNLGANGRIPQDVVDAYHRARLTR